MRRREDKLPTIKWEAPSLVVMGEDLYSRGCGFKSRHRILDEHFFTLICCIVCLKRPKVHRPGMANIQFTCLVERKPVKQEVQLYSDTSAYEVS